MGTGTFGVTVSLAHYFSDERARCLMAAPGSRRARWLARRLRRTFRLPGRVALLSRGRLLPPAEPLALLRPGDTLEAIPATARVVDLSRDPTSERERSLRAKRRRRESPAPLSESPAPIFECPAPHSESPAPIFECPAPLSESPAPYGESPVPLCESLAPYSESPVPLSEASISIAPPREPPPTPPAAECLYEVKRRALALLALHEQQPASAGAGAREGERGRRRRRVRRRRAPGPAPAPLRADAAAEELPAAEVLRNARGGGQRAARRVRALPAAAARAELRDATLSSSADDVHC